MTKKTYIAQYIAKYMRNNKLPYGMEYLNRLNIIIKKAERAWNKVNNHSLTLKF